MLKGQTVALLYGGKSVEHAVSCRSAATMYQRIKACGLTIIPIAIDRKGQWSLQEPASDYMPSAFKQASEVIIRPGHGLWLPKEEKPLPIDICFPVTHGSGGEDGLLQGLLELTNLPYVGCGVQASAVGMHKHLAKIVAQQAGISVLPSYLCQAQTIQPYRDAQNPEFMKLFSAIQQKLGPSIIAKPNDGGSSVGISVLHPVSSENLWQALHSAFRFTQTVLLEPFLQEIQEIECAVVSTKGQIYASEAGLVVDSEHAKNHFLTYEQKYLSSQQAYIQVPAPLAQRTLLQISEQAKIIAQSIGVQGYARVDFFYKSKTGEIWFNEINTLPGMTAQSHFPTLVQTMGYTWETVIETLLLEGFFAYNQRSVRQVQAVE
ncbi:MAG: D-alanine--D-alanine ligase [Sphaerochaetaceae bacterium]|nr:D-alanine--D-alanine ligase [Sphaerochaetaceae bacterium]